MASRKLLTISLSPEIFQFLESTSKTDGFSKSSLVKRALEYYRRYTLQKKLIDGFKSQDDIDINDAMSDFSDYLKIVDL